jgi:hypothetical protein
MIPAIRTEMIIAGPAIPATIPVTTKIPEPMIAPIPSAVAPNRPISRFNPAGSGGAGDILPDTSPYVTKDINPPGRKGTIEIFFSKNPNFNLICSCRYEILFKELS